MRLVGRDGDKGTEMVGVNKMPERCESSSRAQVLIWGGRGGVCVCVLGARGGGSCDRPWPLFHTCLAAFAVSDINIYHVSSSRESDNGRGWKNNKR